MAGLSAASFHHLDTDGPPSISMIAFIDVIESGFGNQGLERKCKKNLSPGSRKKPPPRHCNWGRPGVIKIPPGPSQAGNFLTRLEEPSRLTSQGATA